MNGKGPALRTAIAAVACVALGVAPVAALAEPSSSAAAPLGSPDEKSGVSSDNPAGSKAVQVDPDDNPEHLGGPEHAPEFAIADALSLSAGATCLEHDRLTEQVAGWLERDHLDPRLTIVVDGDPDQEATVRFTLRDRGEILSERSFTPGPSRCDDLHAVVALAIAMAVDATVLESAGVVEAEPEEPPPEEPPPEPKPKEEKVSAVPPQPLELTPPPAPWKFRGALGAMLGVQVPPNLGGGGHLGVELTWKDRVDIGVGGLALGAPPRPIEGSEVRLTLAGSRLDLCAGPRRWRVRPRGCVGGILGAAIARGQNFEDVNYRTVVPWLAATAGAGVRVPIGERVKLALSAEAVITLVRPVFDGVDEFGVQRFAALPWVGAMFGAGIVVDLGEGRGVLRP